MHHRMDIARDVITPHFNSLWMGLTFYIETLGAHLNISNKTCTKWMKQTWINVSRFLLLTQTSVPSICRSREILSEDVWNECYTPSSIMLPFVRALHTRHPKERNYPLSLSVNTAVKHGWMCGGNYLRQDLTGSRWVRRGPQLMLL